MKKDKVLIEKYHDIEIYYSVEESRLVADNPKTQEHFEASWIGEIRHQIDESYWEETEEYGIIKSGYFDRELSKVKAIRRNKKTKQCEYKVLDTTDSRYEIGKTQDLRNRIIYPVTEENLQIYDQLVELQKQITELEQAQRRLANTLKEGGKR